MRIRLHTPHFRGYGMRLAILALALCGGTIFATNGIAHALILSRDLQAQLNDTAWYKRCASSGQDTNTDVDTTNNATKAKYKSLGKVPATGLDTAATTYGGGYNQQHNTWEPNNGVQGGGGDDTGISAYDNIKLPGKTAWAELGLPGQVGNALGELPRQTKLEIRYGGQSIVAEKWDKGSGDAEPIDGKDPTVDLWWETARLLDFKNGTAPIKIFVLADQNTPVTPLDGKSAFVAEGDKPVQNCSCGANIDKDTTNLTGSNVKISYNFLVSKGLKPIHAAAIVGNMMWESGGGTTVNPKAVNPSSGAYGIAQWLGGRKTRLNQFASKEKKPVDSLILQLNYLWEEVNGSEKAALAALKKETSLASATVTWERKFERAGANEKRDAERIKGAQAVLKKYGNGAAENDPSVPNPENQCPSAVVDCKNPSINDASISQTRKNIVCVAEKELALWKSKPGYPRPSFSQSGYLKYSQGRREDWCADFASWVYKEAGVPLKKPNWNVPGVWSYQGLAKAGKFEWHSAGGGYKPKPGDLTTYGTRHINIYIETKGGVPQYIGGNQGQGPYPGGSIVSKGSHSGPTGYLSPVDN